VFRWLSLLQCFGFVCLFLDLDLVYVEDVEAGETVMIIGGMTSSFSKDIFFDSRIFSCYDGYNASYRFHNS
jgi:hypothetical protein